MLFKRRTRILVTAVQAKAHGHLVNKQGQDLWYSPGDWIYSTIEGEQMIVPDHLFRHMFEPATESDILSAQEVTPRFQLNAKRHERNRNLQQAALRLV